MALVIGGLPFLLVLDLSKVQYLLMVLFHLYRMVSGVTNVKYLLASGLLMNIVRINHFSWMEKWCLIFFCWKYRLYL